MKFSPRSEEKFNKFPGLAYNSSTARPKHGRAVFRCDFHFTERLFVTDILFAGLALMLIFEGLLPLLAPRAWRETFRRVIEFTDGQLRFIGLASIASGVVLFLLVM